MGQSTGSTTTTTTSSSYLPGPQQQIADKFLGSQSMQKVMQAMPNSSATKSRLAGQALSYLGGTPDSSAESSQSYSNVSTKLSGAKYTQQGAAYQPQFITTTTE